MTPGRDANVVGSGISRHARVSVRALRYYEEQGPLAPTRGQTGQRLYSNAFVHPECDFV